MGDIIDYLKQTKMVLVNKDAFDELVKKASANQSVQSADTISRQAAIDVADYTDYTGLAIDDVKKVTDEVVKGLKQLPSAQPERLTDDDFETIRIHLSAFKEELCSQHRWAEAEEYQRIIDRFMGFASSQPQAVIKTLEQPIRTFVELVVEYPDPELCTYTEYKGKPYYSIKYIENGETYIGYGTYKPEVLSQYLKEYFISSAQPERRTDATD